MTNINVLAIVFLIILYNAFLFVLEPYDFPYLNLIVLLGLVSMILILSMIFSSYHRKGMKYTRQGNFLQAIPQFEKSIAYFSNHSRLDKYRMFTMLSVAKRSYREMGLLNLAFCYIQSDKVFKAEQIYNQIAIEYPKSMAAKINLKLLKHNTEQPAKQIKYVK